jgi:hypothetical protein
VGLISGRSALILPITVPMRIGSSHSKGKHPGRVVTCPPRSGDFQTRLDDVSNGGRFRSRPNRWEGPSVKRFANRIGLDDWSCIDDRRVLARTSSVRFSLSFCFCCSIHATFAGRRRLLQPQPDTHRDDRDRSGNGSASRIVARPDWQSMEPHRQHNGTWH